MTNITEAPKIFIIGSHLAPTESMEELQNAFRVRTPQDSRGIWRPSGKNNVKEGRRQLRTIRPDVIVAVNPLDNSDVANIMSAVSRREDGSPVPAVVTLLTQEPSALIRASSMAAEPLRGLGVREDLLPTRFGTVINDSDEIVVFSSQEKSYRSMYKGEQIRSVSEQEADLGTTLTAYLNEALERHGRPQIGEWDVKDRRSKFQKAEELMIKASVASMRFLTQLGF